MQGVDARARASISKLSAELADEHRRIEAHLTRLTVPGPLAELRHRLETLHTLLVSHFAREQIVSAEHREALRFLVDEHFALLSALRALIDHACRADSGNAAELLRDVRALVGQLRTHEQTERRLAAELSQRSVA